MGTLRVGHVGRVAYATATTRLSPWQAEGPMPEPRPVSEVKGLWFVVGRRYVLENHGARVLEQCIALLGEKYGAVLESPMASVWYPEEALQQTLGVLDLVIAGGDPAEFVRVIEGCSLLAVNSFFRTLLRLVPPATMLRKIPTMWTLIRRGAGRVRVEAGPDEAIAGYSEFPYFDDAHYRLLTVGAIQSLLTLCKAENPRVDVTSHTRDALTVRAVWGRAAHALPK
jgi:hypothetical protein